MEVSLTLVFQVFNFYSNNCNNNDKIILKALCPKTLLDGSEMEGKKMRSGQKVESEFSEQR